MSEEPTGATPEVTDNPAIGESEDHEAQRMLADAIRRGDDEPLRGPGKRALEAERQARKDLERQLAELAPLRKLAEALKADTPESDGKSEIDLLRERLENHEAQLAAERLARWRAEVAAEKGLSAALAERLRGNTKEELLADADALLALIPTQQQSGPRTPAPDPTQGARGPVDIDALIAEAQAKGDVRTAIALKARKLINTK